MVRKLPEEEKAELKRKIEESRDERVQRIVEESKEESSFLAILFEILTGWP